MSRRSQILAGLGAASLAAAGGFYAWQRQQEQQHRPTAATVVPAGPAAIPVHAEPARTGEVIEHLYAFGNLRPRLEVAITAGQPGQVRRILFADGETVAAGTPLVEMDSRTAHAQAESARARAVGDQQNLRRVEALARRGLESTSSLEQAQTQAAASLSSQRIAEAQLDMTTLRAPFAGTLGPRQVDAGAIVGGTDRIVTLEDRRQLTIELRVPSRYLARLRPGMVFDVDVPDHGIDLGQGRLSYVDVAVSTDTRSLLLRGVLDNREGRLIPGLFVRVALELAQRPDAVLVPEGAVLRDLLGTYVFTLERDGAARRRPIRVGLRRGGMVEALEGLRPGERVVTTGAFRLRDGDPVAEQPPTTLPSAAPPATVSAEGRGGR